MLLHQKEASLGILSAFMYSYKQLNKEKKYIYIGEAVFNTSLWGSSLLKVSPYFCAVNVSLFCVHFCQFEIKLAWQTWQEKEGGEEGGRGSKAALNAWEMQLSR